MEDRKGRVLLSIDPPILHVLQQGKYMCVHILPLLWLMNLGHQSSLLHRAVQYHDYHRCSLKPRHAYSWLTRRPASPHSAARSSFDVDRNLRTSRTA